MFYYRAMSFVVVVWHVVRWLRGRLAGEYATNGQVQWQRASTGDWTAYAADISRRNRPGPAAAPSR